MSKTPRTDDFVECYATGMNREVAPHHKFMRVADFARQLFYLALGVAVLITVWGM